MDQSPVILIDSEVYKQTRSTVWCKLNIPSLKLENPEGSKLLNILSTDVTLTSRKLHDFTSYQTS